MAVRTRQRSPGSTPYAPVLVSRPDPPPEEPQPPPGFTNHTSHDRRRIREHARIRDHPGANELRVVWDERAHGKLGRTARLGGHAEGRDHGDVTNERALRKRVHAQANLVADANAADVSLVDAEIQLERVRATDDEQLTSGIDPRSKSLVRPRRQNDTR